MEVHQSFFILYPESDMVIGTGTAYSTGFIWQLYQINNGSSANGICTITVTVAALLL
jgi:hypothetical protein